MDDDAFADMVRNELPSVYAFLARYLGDAAAAEDATQETFVKAWKHSGRFDASRPVRPWLFSIARNAGNDFLRGKKALPFSRLVAFGKDDEEIPFEDRLADPSPLPPEIFERAETGRLVAQALLKLPPRDRAVLTLRYQEEMPFEDIAAVMGAPMNTVKSWHRRAPARLRARITPLPGAGI